MYDIEEVSEKIKICNGEVIRAIKQGKLKVTFIQNDKSEVEAVVTNMKYAPKL